MFSTSACRRFVSGWIIQSFQFRLYICQWWIADETPSTFCFNKHSLFFYPEFQGNILTLRCLRKYLLISEDVHWQLMADRFPQASIGSLCEVWFYMTASGACWHWSGVQPPFSRSHRPCRRTNSFGAQDFGSDGETRWEAISQTFTSMYLFVVSNRTDEVKITYNDDYFNTNVEFDPIEVVCTATSVLVGDVLAHVPMLITEKVPIAVRVGSRTEVLMGSAPHTVITRGGFNRHSLWPADFMLLCDQASVFMFVNTRDAI